ncbi:DedA family protein [Ectobacillus panaciterrae]|uniref:DedA family protein n=1 Tax=Ectobacillus panaciterrae TaxID=363872 RepID=UPI00040059D2|nr:DedA family protein [Ectobacillus panaciterrae]
MGSVTTDILMWFTSLGYLGIGLGLMIEIIPSEIVLAYGGYMVSQGTIHFSGAVIAGLIGGTVAQWFLYWIGSYGGRPFLQKYGKYLLIQPHHLNRAENWFHKYGSGVVLTARFIPVVRHAISVPAGIAKMSFSRFTLLTLIAMIPWSILFIYLGETLGSHWGNIEEVAGVYTKPAAIIAVTLIVLYIAIKRIRKNISTIGQKRRDKESSY